MTIDIRKMLFYTLFGFIATFNAAADEEKTTDSLAEYVQNAETNKQEATDKKEKGESNKTEEGDTWINNLVTTVAEKGSAAIASVGQDTQAPIHRSNASVFDISGIMLRMNREQTAQAMQKRGYRKTYENLEIPNFIRWRYEELCRNQGVVGFERIGNCVVKMAKQKNYQYVQHEKYANFHTKEEIEVFYTSNFTGNKVHRIMYHTEAANVTGSGAKAAYLQNLKVFEFWKKINQKYGVPDNKEQVIWGLGENKPYLQAATGRLILTDPMLLELDYTRMSREDQKFMNTAVYTF